MWRLRSQPGARARSVVPRFVLMTKIAGVLNTGQTANGTCVFHMLLIGARPMQSLAPFSLRSAGGGTAGWLGDPRHPALCVCRLVSARHGETSMKRAQECSRQ